jgi:hypothetical protein
VERDLSSRDGTLLLHQIQHQLEAQGKAEVARLLAGCEGEVLATEQYHVLLGTIQALVISIPPEAQGEFNAEVQAAIVSAIQSTFQGSLYLAALRVWPEAADTDSG